MGSVGCKRRLAVGSESSPTGHASPFIGGRLVIGYSLIENRTRMKIFSLALVCAILVPVSQIEARSRASSMPSPTPIPSSKGARLIIQRAPNFGSDLSIRVSIDGKKVANVPRNQHYGGILAPGRHVITLLALPNIQSRQPTSMALNLKAGKVYIFTATWESDRLLLRPSNFYMPSTRANR